MKKAKKPGTVDTVREREREREREQYSKEQCQEKSCKLEIRNNVERKIRGKT